jgi:hypothetical protein
MSLPLYRNNNNTADVSTFNCGSSSSGTEDDDVNVNGANHDNDDDDDDEEDENEEDSDLENGQFRIRRHDEELNDYLTVGLNKKDDDTDIHSSRTKYQIMWSRCYRLAGGILVLLSLDFVITRAYGRAFLFASASAIPTTVTATPTGTAMSTSSIGKNSLHVLMEDSIDIQVLPICGCAFRAVETRSILHIRAFILSGRLNKATPGSKRPLLCLFWGSFGIGQHCR